MNPIAFPRFSAHLSASNRPGNAVSSATHLTGPSPIKFQGDFAGPAVPVTIKLPARAEKQLNALSQTLGVPAEEIATTASWLYTHATDVSSLRDYRAVGLVNRDALSKQFRGNSTRPSGGTSLDRYFHSFDLSKSEWKSWKKANVQELSLSRGIGKKTVDTMGSKKPFRFRHQGTESEDGTGLMLFLSMVIPPLQLLLPLTVPAYLLSKTNPKKALCNGLDLLEKAVAAKQKDPSLALVSIEVDSRIGDNSGKPMISLTAEDKIFRNLANQ